MNKLNCSALGQFGPGEQGQCASRHGLGLCASEVVEKARLGHDPKYQFGLLQMIPEKEGSRKINSGI